MASPGYAIAHYSAPLPDIAVLNDMDRFHLVRDVADRVPQVGANAAYLKLMHDIRIEHRDYITQ